MSQKLTKEQVISAIVDVRDQLIAAKLNPEDTAGEYIVVVGGIPIDPEVHEGKIKVGKVRVNLPHLVCRFGLEEAQAVADLARDKKGMPGFAVRWKDAVQFRLEEIARCLHNLGVAA